MNEFLDIIHSKWQPHSGQLEVAKAVFKSKKDLIFLRCGRKFGKTEITLYIIWRMALETPNSEIYYICSDAEHGGKVLWENRRLELFGPEGAIKSTNESKMSIRLTNGSNIRIIGSENVRASNGLSPDLVIYDEFAEFRPAFHRSMNPNRAAKGAPLVIIGTPPLVDSRNREQYYQVEKLAKEKGFHLQLNSYSNPHVDKAWLDEERQNLITQGEEYIWLSQYMAEDTAGGKNVVFANFNANNIKEFPTIGTHKKYLLSNINDTIHSYHILIQFNGTHIHIVNAIKVTNKSTSELKAILNESFGNLKGVNKYSTSLYDDFIQLPDIYKDKTIRLSQLQDIIKQKLLTMTSKCDIVEREFREYTAKDSGVFRDGNDNFIYLIRSFLEHVYYTNTPPKIAKKDNKFAGIQRADDPWAEDDWLSPFDL